MNNEVPSAELRKINQQARECWEANADWWDEQFGEGNRFQLDLIGPSTERLLALTPGDVVLDIACGNGAFSRRMAQLGASVVAFDFSERFLDRAKFRTTRNGELIQYANIDATDKAALLTLGKQRYDAAVCSMAFMDMATIEPILSALTELLKEDGCLVFSVLHPCFNNSDGTRLAIEEADQQGQLVTTHFVKVHRYITPSSSLGVGIPGQPQPHMYFHRPISELYNSCFRAGFVMEGIEEPTFQDTRSGARGPFSWDNFRDIPPVLITKMRLSRKQRPNLS